MYLKISRIAFAICFWLTATSTRAQEAIPFDLYPAVEIEVETEAGAGYQWLSAESLDEEFVPTGELVTGTGGTLTRFFRLNGGNPRFFQVEKRDSSVVADAEELRLIGWAVSRNLPQLELTPEEQAVCVAAFRQALQGQFQPENENEAINTANIWFSERIAAVNAANAAAFLDSIRASGNIQETDSGLLYEILEAGNAERAAPDATVIVHYTGTLADGTEFDSSFARGEPASFPLGDVIPGFREGLQLIGEGGKIVLYLSPELGYGAGGTNSIPPNSALVFEVELIEIL